MNLRKVNMTDGANMIRSVFLVLAIIIMATGVIGCGKKTLPKPPAEVSWIK